MGDIATTWDTAAGVGDWALSLAESLVWTDQNGNAIVDQNGLPVSAQFTAGTGLVIGDDLFTAVVISLFTDATASSDDPMPDPAGDPRGWWGGPVGSKIWLRLRSKATALVPALVKDDVQQALAWLVEDGVAASVEVIAEWTRPAMLGVQATIRRTDGTLRALAFSRYWENT